MSSRRKGSASAVPYLTWGAGDGDEERAVDRGKKALSGQPALGTSVVCVPGGGGGARALAINASTRAHRALRPPRPMPSVCGARVYPTSDSGNPVISSCFRLYVPGHHSPLPQGYQFTIYTAGVQFPFKLWYSMGILEVSLVVPGIESWTLVILDWHCTVDPRPLPSEANSRSFAYFYAQPLSEGFWAGGLPLRHTLSPHWMI